MSGVLFTHDLNHGSPYYVINYFLLPERLARLARLVTLARLAGRLRDAVLARLEDRERILRAIDNSSL